jgi:hypothetical protein
MEQIGAVDPNQFIHVRMVLSMVVGLAIARLFAGLARFVQHPGRLKVYSIHALWALYMFIALIHFWWWEFALSRVPTWHFLAFAFIVGYAALLYLLCVILFPDDLAEYEGFRDYFLSRRKWFFGILGLTLVFDVIDTSIKGSEYLAAQGIEYALRSAVGVCLCGIAAHVENERFHMALVVGALVYQASWILRLYDVLG